MLMQITLETGEIGRQASCAITAIDGETVRLRWMGRCFSYCIHGKGALVLILVDIRIFLQIIYTTVCADMDNASDGSFAPLQVNYTERFSAAGRTT